MSRPVTKIFRFILASTTAAAFFGVCHLALGDREQDTIAQNAQDMIQAGRQTFRFDTFGDESFWGEMLKLHQAIEGATFGGVGSGVSPATALATGLKVDAD